MEQEKTLLEKIKSVDDQTLKSGIENIARSMGADVSKIAPYLKDMEKLKKTIAGISESDMERLKSAIGEEKMNDIVENIKKEIG